MAHVASAGHWSQERVSERFRIDPTCRAYNCALEGGTLQHKLHMAMSPLDHAKVPRQVANASSRTHGCLGPTQFPAPTSD
eukprot:1731509-Amphidinium_carterae.1